MVQQPKLKAVVHGGRNHNRYCGPAAISIISQINTAHAAKLIRGVYHSRYVKSTSQELMHRVLDKLGFFLEGWKSGNRTLNQWAKLSRKAPGKPMFLVVVGCHYVVVQGNRCCCGMTMTPKLIKDSPKIRAHVTSAWIVTRVRDVEVKKMLPDKPAKKWDPMAFARIKAKAIAKETGVTIDDLTKEGGSLWVYPPAGMFEDENEEKDPYYDEHSHDDDWNSVLKAVQTYAALVLQHAGAS